VTATVPTQTAAAQRIRFATTRLATGVEVHYAEQDDDGAEVLLFLHGWPDSWYSFSRVLELLPRDQYRALCYDQRGFGDSSRPSDGYTIDDYAADAVAFLDAVGVAGATVVGHSFGSFVARRVAEIAPDRVHGLVLIGPAVTPINDVMLDVGRIVAELDGVVSPEFAREFCAETLHVPVPEWFFEGVLAEGLKAPARTWKRAFEGMMAFDDTAEQANITAPTLILWGEHDALFSRRDQTDLLAAIPGAQLVVYPDTGHCPNWERPDRVVADLVAFLSGDSSPAT
jgi:non-heme chloroperoxidase